MGFQLNEPLTKNKIDLRREGLIVLGISMKCIDSISRCTKNNLLEPNTVKLRMENLSALGFDIEAFIETDPSILMRKKATVKTRFNILSKWFKKIDKTVDVHELLMTRTQLWSVGRHKLQIIWLLANSIQNNVIPGRICNMATQNLENILLAYCIDGATVDFMELYNCAFLRGRKKLCLDKFKKTLICDNKSKFPSEVFAYYQKYYVK